MQNQNMLDDRTEFLARIATLSSWTNCIIKKIVMSSFKSMGKFQHANIIVDSFPFRTVGQGQF